MPRWSACRRSVSASRRRSRPEPATLARTSATCDKAGPDGWTTAATDEGTEESPGSTGTRCRLTAGGGDPRESATENKPPGSPWETVGLKGKGETVRQERTARLVTGAAG